MSFCRRAFLAVAATTMATGLTITTAASDEGARIFANPPMLLTETPDAKARLRADLTSGSPGEILYDLDVVKIRSRIWNPATHTEDEVILRGYTGDGVDPDAPYVAPTIEMRPGQTVRMTLNNKLDVDESCISHSGDVNQPHCFNGTNMHTHGLWVNPAGNGDNVLISINPGVSFQYEYNVPPDHPAGTFWYHPHRHGSTALQVSSGMAGALIIRGERDPTLDTNGDLDTLLRPTGFQPFTDRVLLFQQIQYACRYQDGPNKGQIKTTGTGDNARWICDDGDIGTIERYFGPDGDGCGKACDQFGPGTWTQSDRYTSINGQVLPVFTGARTGDIERWRMIHAGVRDTISVTIRKQVAGASKNPRIAPGAQDAYVDETCTGDPVTYHLVAADGLTYDRMQATGVSVLQPGYRFDALVAFDEPGVYCILDDEIAAGSAVNANAPSRALLGLVEVEKGPPVNGTLTEHIVKELSRAAQVNLPADVVQTVQDDLADDLKLTKFVPHTTLMNVPESDIEGTQELVFNIDVFSNPVKFTVDGKPYLPSRVDRTLPLGAIQDWTLSSDFVGHPFHIHVNPFQVVKILDPNGKDVTAPGAVDDYNWKDPSKPGPIDPQYAGMKGVWKDTLFVKNPGGDPKTSKDHKYTVVVRTHYRRYIGEFVLHCHILDHEDQGMMQNIAIALPDGAGGVAALGHD